MAKIDELLESIDALSVAELAELVKGIEEKYGVSAAAVAAPVAGAAGAADGREILSSGHPYLHQRGRREKKYRRGRTGFQTDGKNFRRYFQKRCETAVEPFSQPGIQISVQHPVFCHVCEICFFQCDKGAVSGESFCRRAQAGSGGGSSVWLFYHSGDH